MEDPANDASPSLPVRFGRYHVVAAIPGGSMGQLFLAQDPEIDRLVVVKALDRDCSTEQKQRFLREARAAGRLNHPNVVAIYDVGEHERQPFIVMEYIVGETLSAIIKDRQPLLFARRLELVDHLCAGLAYAHDQGVIHRDIKPSNLMLDKSGQLRILDFGIARLDTSDQTQTSTGIVGTLNYMSPEQWEGGVIEGRSDMFSVGAVIYELFSYTRAFPGTTPPEVLRTMFGAGPRPLEDVCPLAPPELAEIVARMLARNPEDRYPNLHQVREALARLRANLHEAEAFDERTRAWGAAGVDPATAAAREAGAGGPARRTRASGWADTPAFHQTGVQPGTRTLAVKAVAAGEQDRRRKRAITIGASIAAGGVIAVAAWFAFTGSTPPPPAGQTAAPAQVSSPPTGTDAPLAAPSGGSAGGGSAAGGAGTTPPAGTPVEAGPAGARGTPPLAPPAPVKLSISWTLPFELVQNGKKLTPTARERHDLTVDPAQGEVYAQNAQYLLHARIPTSRPDSIRLPEPGLLAVTMAPSLLGCTVVVDGTALRVGNIIPDRPVTIAAGNHRVSLRCGNQTEGTQTVNVRSGRTVTVVKFPQ